MQFRLGIIQSDKYANCSLQAIKSDSQYRKSKNKCQIGTSGIKVQVKVDWFYFTFLINQN